MRETLIDVPLRNGSDPENSLKIFKLLNDDNQLHWTSVDYATNSKVYLRSDRKIGVI